MNLCCDTLSWLILDKGQKGFSVLAAKIDAKYCFVLQGRSHDIEDNTEKHVIFQQTIHFCPGCGTELATLIQQDESGFLEIFDSCRNFLI